MNAEAFPSLHLGFSPSRMVTSFNCVLFGNEPVGRFDSLLGRKDEEALLPHTPFRFQVLLLLHRNTHRSVGHVRR